MARAEGASSPDPFAARLVKAAAFAAAGLPEPAIDLCRAVLAEAPHHAAAATLLGGLLLEAGDPAAAAAVLAPLAPPLTAPPARALFLRGAALRALGDQAGALAAFTAATTADPALAEAHNGRGAVLQALGRRAEALAAYTAAGDLPEALANAAACQRERGDWRAARALAERAFSAGGGGGLRFQRALALPVIPADRAEIAQARATLAADLAALEADPPALADPHRGIGTTAFYLSYHGLPNRPLLEALARAVRAACPGVAWRPRAFTRRGGRRIRVGFLSKYFYNHSIARTSLGLIERLDRRRFEVLALCLPPARADAMGQRIRAAADGVVELPGSLAACREAVADLGLDVLFYQDIGMEPLSYFLGFARLAPVQCLSFGHPDTTGLPAMDWWISADRFEPPGAEADYSERLWRVPEVGTLAWYHRPQRPPPGALPLPEDRRLYVCPQALFKLHPDFDALAAGILAADPAGVLVLVAAAEPQWTAMLTARLTAGLLGRGIDPGRLVVLPRLSGADFLRLLARADVVLDTPQFNGMNSSLEAFAMGTPVVTLPGPLQRMRHTAAMWGRMGLEDGVATDGADYVRRAVALARDGAATRRALAEAAPALFQDDAVTRGFAAFLEQAVDSAPSMAHLMEV